MAELPAAAVITVAFANLLMAGVFAVLHVRERRPGMAWFACACLLEMGRHLFSLADVTPLTYFAGGATFGAAVLTLVEGAFRFASRRPSWIPRVLVLLLVAWQAVVWFWEPSFAVRHVPVSLFTSVMRLLVAVMLWRAGGPVLGRSVAAAAMGLWSLHASTYPFLANVPSAAPWGFALSALLGLVTAMGVLMAYFERARAEADASEARLRSVFDGASDGIAALDRDGKVVTANPALARLLGYDHPDALSGASLAQLAGGPSLVGDPTLRGVEEWRRRDGSTRLVSVSISKRRAGERLDRVDVFARDVTEETRLKQELEETRRLEAIGRLAAGVAHDFNNLLQVISGVLELAVRPGDHQRRQRQIGMAQEAAARGAELTRQLLAFGGKQTVAPRRLDLRAVVREIADWVPRLLGDHVSLEVELPDEPLVISADRGQLEQVLLNLATNARDAMPRGGVLRITAQRDGPRHVVLEVEDDGEGMDEATRARAFEPFFTTKERGRGTGLGLATVHGIAAQQGWQVEVASAPSRGTRFSIRFATEDGDLDASEPAREVAPVPRGGRVLVVDDDPALRAVVTEILSHAGYDVLGVDSSAQALARLADGGWDVLVTDVDMSETSGPRLARSARDQQASLGVVFISGHAGEALGPLDLRTAFVPKPFRSEDLVAAIERVALRD